MEAAHPPDYWTGSDRRYVLYALICFAYLSNGIDLALVSPSLQDLAGLMEITLVDISYGFSVKSMANCVASIAAGFTFHRFSRQLQYTLAMLVYGVCTILLPRLRGVQLYSLASGLLGASSAFIDITTNVWILELFARGNVNLHVQVVHFAFAIGQVAGPLMVQPYLAPPRPTNDTRTAHEFFAEQSHIQLPFAVGGCLFVGCSLAMLFCWLFKPYVPPDRSIDGKDLPVNGDGRESCRVHAGDPERPSPSPSRPGSAQSNDREPLLSSVDDLDQTPEPGGPARRAGPLPAYFYWLVIFLIQCVNALEVSSEYNFYYYLPTYLTHSVHRLDNQTSAYMASLVGGAYALGRFASIFATLETGVHRNIYACVSLLLVGNLLLFACPPGQLHRLAPIVLLFGFGFSSLFPSMLVFIEQRVNITNSLNASMLAISAVLFSVNSIVIGNNIEHSPQLFLYLNLAYPLLFLALFIALHCTDLLKQRLLKLD